MEIERCARLIFTASSVGSAFIASATVRVRHKTRSHGPWVTDWGSAFINQPHPTRFADAGKAAFSTGILARLWVAIQFAFSVGRDSVEPSAPMGRNPGSTESRPAKLCHYQSAPSFDFAGGITEKEGRI